MADTTPSPNMSMPVPTVSVAPGPDWATDLNACLSVLDGHTHNPGQGAQITPSGILINADFPMNGNNITTVRSLRMTSQGAVLSLGTDLGCIFNVLGDLYYNDGNGNHIRITQSGSVSGSAGTITGLPSGTASASYAGGTFTFLAATNTPAAMAVGPVSIGNSSAGSKTVTLAPDVSIAANYSITFPAALPAALNYVTLDNTGALSFNASGKTGTGAVVLAAAPTLTGNVPAFQIIGLSTYPGANTASTSLKVPGLMYVNSSTVSNSGTGETDLFSYTFPANSFGTNDTIDFQIMLVLAANSNSKTVKLYIGTTSVTILSTTNNGNIYSCPATLKKRTGVNLQTLWTFDARTLVTTQTSLSEDMTSNLVIKITGQGSTTSDIGCSLFRLLYIPGS